MRIVIILLCVLLLTSCDSSDNGRVSSLPDDIQLTSKSEQTTASESSIEETTTKESINWDTDNIKVLNNISHASIYSVYADVGNPAITGDDPVGYTTWNGNVTRLYTNGFYCEHTIGRDSYRQAADSQQFIDINTLPDEFVNFADGYDLYDYVEIEEYPKEKDAESMLADWGIPTENIVYPIKHVAIRQSFDGIPTMPLRGSVQTEGEKLGYGEYVKQGGVWSFSQMPVDLFNGEYAAEYLIIPGLKLKDTVAADLEIIPFDNIKEKIKPEVIRSVSIPQGMTKKDIEDITVTAAEVCYFMIYNNYAEYEKSTEFYLVPYWVIYYKCGINSGLTQQGAAFIPAVSGIAYE